MRHIAAVPPIVEAEPVLELVEAARSGGGHPFHVLRRLFARGWDRGDPSGDLLSDDDHAEIAALLG